MKKRRVITAVETLTTWIGSVSSILVHTGVFLFAFAIGIFEVTTWDNVLLVLTTLVSLEAIYLAIFIQMSVNQNTESLREVEDDVDEIQKDIDEIQEDVDAIEQDVDEIQEDEAEVVIRENEQQQALAEIAERLQTIMHDLEKLKKN